MSVSNKNIHSTTQKEESVREAAQIGVTRLLFCFLWTCSKKFGERCSTKLSPRRLLPLRVLYFHDEMFLSLETIERLSPGTLS